MTRHELNPAIVLCYPAGPLPHRILRETLWKLLNRNRRFTCFGDASSP